MSLGTWALEVIRGTAIGRRYPLTADSTILGNQVNEIDGINLAHQEGSGPRKMAGQQAIVEKSKHGFLIRDLSSPGGTFLNRQRLMPGQPKPLASGDLLQLGGVQLRLVATTPSSSPSGGSVGLPIRLELTGGVVCRSWDEILTISAQKWSLLREELTAGRLDAFVRSSGYPQLAVSSTGTPDERLDEWLGRIPVSKSTSPILDAVHPSTLVIKVSPGGGQTRRTITVANVGYRLLKVEPRIEPEVDWLKLTDASAKNKLTVIESATISLDIFIPDQMKKPLSTKLRLDSNGGSQEVAIRLEPVDAAGSVRLEPRVRPPHEPSLARVSLPMRLARFAGAAFVARLLLAVSDAWLSPEVVPGGIQESPQLVGPIMAFGVAGGLLGLAVGMRARIDARAIVPNSIAIACAFALMGLFVATILVAVCRAMEPLLGLIGQSRVGQPLLWAGLGSLLALISWWIIPYQRRKVTA